MGKKIFICMIILVALLAANSIILPVVSEGETIEFGNMICPVSGGNIGEHETFKYEHNGVVYNLCCKMCVKDFKKDPEKYIKKLESQKEAEGKTGAHSGMHE